MITFNWDTLMDRALERTSAWRVESGYGVVPAFVYDDQWYAPDYRTDNSPNAPLLLKLHGSSNWLTSYMMIRETEWGLIQEAPANTVYLFRNARRPFSTHDGPLYAWL